MLIVHSDQDHEVWVDEYDGRIWLHQTVRHWALRTLKQSRAILAFLHGHFKADLWVCDNDYDKAPNLPRYLAALGFTPKELIACNGMIRTCFLKRK